MLDIIGIGDADVDIMIHVDHIPSHDEKVRGSLMGLFPGGIIANFCCAASTFGAKAGAVCKVGQDSYGQIALQDLKNRGVDTAGMVVDPGAQTYFSVVHLDNTGEKALTVVVTSGFLPKKEDLDFEYIRSAKRVHMTTLDLDLVDFVGQALKGSDVKLSLDIEGTASKADWETWKRVLGCIDTAFPNEAGLAALCKTTDIQKGAQMLLNCGVKTVVVTCGAKGVKIFEKGVSFEHPIFPVEVKDTTGAGDCFNAVYLSCLTKGWPMEKAAKYASAAAAISVSAVGSRTAQPTLQQVETFIAERELGSHAN